jgi:hypothetical protein
MTQQGGPEWRRRSGPQGIGFRHSLTERAMFERFAADQAVLEALRGRQVVSHFLPDPVPDWIVQEVIATGSRASTRTPLPNWNVHVARGASKDRVCAAVRTAAKARDDAERHACMPDAWWEAFPEQAMPLRAADDGMHTEPSGDGSETFDLLGAPVGLFFLTRMPLLQDSWLELGMVIQAVTMVAQSYRLETCLQKAWCLYDRHICHELGFSAGFAVAAGMPMGYARTTAKGEELGHKPISPDHFATFHN